MSFKLKVAYGSELIREKDGKRGGISAWVNQHPVGNFDNGDLKSYTFQTEGERQAFLNGLAEGKNWYDYYALKIG